jgi:hypothetical protein
VEKSTSWAVNSRPVNENIRTVLQKPQVYYGVYKSQSLDSLRQLKSVCGWNLTYSPQTWRLSLIGMRQMRLRKITWRMTRCYYPSWKHSHNALAHCTLLEMLDVFSLCVVAEQSVAHTSTSPVVPTIAAAPRTAQDMPPTPPQPPPRENHLVICGL